MTRALGRWPWGWGLALLGVWVASVLAFPKEILVSSVNELANCAAGVSSQRGDVCLVAIGTYDLAGLGGGTVSVSVEGLTVRSVAGPFVTLLIGNGAAPLVSVEADSVTVEGFLFSNAGAAALVQVSDPASRNVRISGNLFTDLVGPYRDGVRFSASSLQNVILANNTLWRGSGNGVWFDSSVQRLSHVELTDLRVVEMGGTGIKVEARDVSDLLVWKDLRCDLQRLGGAAIEVQSARDIRNVAVVGCQIQDNQGAGVSLRAAGKVSEVTLMNDEVRANGASGLEVVGQDLEGVRLLNSELSYNEDGIRWEAGDRVENALLSQSSVSTNRSAGMVLRADQVSGVRLEGVTGQQNPAQGVWWSVGRGLEEVLFKDSNFSHNQAAGVRIEVEGTVTDLRLEHNRLEHNGGSGYALTARQLQSFYSQENGFEGNGEHGLYVQVLEQLQDLTLEGDRFADQAFSEAVDGTGAWVSAGGNVLKVSVQGAVFTANAVGLRLESTMGSLSQVSLEGLEMSSNAKAGVLVFAQEVASNVGLRTSSIAGSQVGLSLQAAEGEGVRVEGVKFRENALGLDLKASHALITHSTFQGNEVGLAVDRSEGSAAHQNNFQGNLTLAIELTQLAAGPFDAVDNWWGDSSGPWAPGRAPGRGDRVSEGVQFEPFLTSPV